MSNITNAQLAADINALVQLWTSSQDQFAAWLAGTVGGGDSSNGTYPLTDALGRTIVVESPAQLAADIAVLVAEGSGAVADATVKATAAAASAATAVTSATQAATSATNAATQAGNAATSASQAASSAAAAVSAKSGLTAAVASATASASDASTSATAADASASAASTSATAAAASAVLAATFDPSLFLPLTGGTITGAGLSVNTTHTGVTSDITVRRAVAGTAGSVGLGANIQLENDASGGAVTAGLIQSAGGNLELWNNPAGTWFRGLYLDASTNVQIPRGLTVSGGATFSTRTVTGSTTLTAADAGGTVYLGTLPANVTIPLGVFSVPTIITIVAFNNTGVATILPGTGVTLFLANGTSTHQTSVTLTSVGVATIYINGPNAVVFKSN